MTVTITANHLGYFQFKMCQVPGFETEATQECLDECVLSDDELVARVSENLIFFRRSSCYIMSCHYFGWFL